ncbi:vWA domain-containing protein [Echinimonas agarilytica]|uniref:VWA domain-containing protein n=1 Tax=Echinimonas agarilytica TaxID=1215918 RepID=A0AA42B7H6_9GAMM|nr:VWA domain-containing protein [Echinimonas agarilytica]MCM2680050.1 VWA domain-containing protein [Echinimonas agarilytica]
MKKTALCLAVLVTVTACSQNQAAHNNAGESASQPRKARHADMTRAAEQQTLVMSAQASQKLAAISYMAPPPSPQQAVSTENYQDLESHDVILVSEQPVSTFSSDVDTASYANIRRFINNGAVPPKDAVRIEEMVNYFHYDYANPSSEQHPIAVDTLLTTSPWNQQNQIIRIGVSTYQQDTAQRPDANLVFLIDVSGSMQSKDKLPLLQQSLMLMLDQLRGTDRVSIVTYASGTQIALKSTPVSQKADIQRAISNLRAGGSTHGEAGIELAYQQAAHGFIDDGINHVLLMSDGDLNVGIRDVEQLKDRIKLKRQSGVQFSTYGFGRGNYNDHLMEQLADHGNGLAGYIDTLHEAQKLLVDQIGSSLHTVAHDVKFQVEFNPALVSEYRLIGYENRQLNREDFNNDQKDAGDIGAGHTVTALYEITPVGSQGLVDPLVFQAHDATQYNNHQTLAEVRVRYKSSQGQASNKIIAPIDKDQFVEFDAVSQDDRFALSVAAFGQKLRGSDYLAQLGYAEIIDWANQSRGQDPFGYRAEFVKLARLGQVLAEQKSAVARQPHSEPPIAKQVRPARMKSKAKSTYELSQ